jgi:membrane associated rhomboid family serine protease
VFALPPLLPFTRRLLIVLAGFYLVEIVLVNWMRIPFSEWLALETGSIRLKTLWSVVTYPAAFDTSPDGIFRALIDFLFLWWMVSPLEQQIGSAKTAGLALVSVLGGSIAAVLVGLLAAPSLVFGPSPILLGAIGAFGVYLRGRRVMFFGAIPMEAIHVVWIAVAFSVLHFLTSKNVVQLVADFGALGAAMAYARYGNGLFRRRGSRKSGPKLRAVRGPEPPRWMN